MFKLIKLAFYAVIGYALYELYQGMKQQQGGGGSGYQGRGFGQATNRGQLTGAGEGMEDITGDASGTAMRHTVGRGVVS
jgi:hypothetical protein